MDETKLKEALKGITPPQVQALIKHQTAAFAPAAVFARGNTTAALRRRGLIQGAMPYARLTPLGEAAFRKLAAER